MAYLNETTVKDEQIQYIMENYYNTDDKQLYEMNLSYLNELSDIELQLLYDKVK